MVRQLNRRWWSQKAVMALSPGFAMAMLFSCLPTGPIGVPDEIGLIDFDEAWVELRAGRRELVVRGYAPTPCHDVSLQAVTYIVQPDYWVIQVIAEPSAEVCAQVLTPYEVRLVLDGNTGTRGIEVVGRDTSERIDIP